METNQVKRASSLPKNLVKLTHDESSYVEVKGIRIAVVQTDITRETTDAIVNAANKKLLHAGGIAGAISRKGGIQIDIESANIINNQGIVSTGSCVSTSSGMLPCGIVIHAVGPIWYAIDDKKLARALLKKAIRSVFQEAWDKGVESLSIPPVSGGIFGYPVKLCAFDIIGQVFKCCLGKPGGPVRYVRLTVLDRETFDAFQSVFEVFRKKVISVGLGAGAGDGGPQGGKGALGDKAGESKGVGMREKRLESQKKVSPRKKTKEVLEVVEKPQSIPLVKQTPQREQKSL